MHAATPKSSWPATVRLAAPAWFLSCLFVPGLSRAGSPPAITNVSVVNVTPSSFSVVWSASAESSTLSVFADPGGVTNLAGEVRIEYYPLHTGDPSLTDAYHRRLNQSLLRQKTIGQGLAQVRVSRCQPNTAYYYRLQATNSSGQTLWPAVGPLPAVTTAQQNTFVLQSQQLLLNLPGFDPSGSIVILSNSNTPSLLAAVAGDGALSNQVYFSVNDLLAATGNTNYLPLGTQQFTVQVLGNSSNTVSQTYSLYFTSDFVVGEQNLFDLGNFAGLTIGSAILRSGEGGSIPLSLYASSITNLSFVLNLPTNRFSSLSVRSTSPQVGSASLQALNSNSVLFTFASAPGQTLNGNQQIAQLDLTPSPNQTSAFLPLAPVSLKAVNAEGSNVGNLAAQAGRLVIIANEPLLEASLAPGGVRTLALYGKPWASYELQCTTNLANPAAWRDFMRVPMTNLVEVFSGLDTRQARIFYRAYEFMADPPLLEATFANQQRALLVYGVPGTNYLVQSATNLSSVVAWYPLLNYTLTNSFQLITGIGTTNPVVFYRIKRP